MFNPHDILRITSKINYSSLGDDEHIVRSPKELLSGKDGTCYDVVELERKLFSGYNFKTYFAYAGLPITDNRTHTFLIFERDGEFFWFESAWASNRGIHGPFESFDDAATVVCSMLTEDWGKKCSAVEFKSFDYSGMTLNDYSIELANRYIY